MQKNETLLNKALALLPELRETPVEPVCCVIPRMENGSARADEFGPCANLTLGKGESLCLDFGDHRVGYLDLELGYTGSHPDAPVVLDIRFAERLSEFFEDADSYGGWICTGWIQDERVRVDTVPGKLSLPRRYAFRYVRIEVKDISSKFRLTVKRAVCREVTSADDSALAPYASGDKRLERLDAIACRTLRNCMQRVFEDGPKRDRRLWMGDLRLQALANYQTYRANDTVKACLYLFAALPMEDGRIPACLFLEPEPEADDTAMFDYSLLYVPALLDYYNATGDREALCDLYPTAMRQIELAKERLNEDGVVSDSDKLGWCFADWNLALNKQASAHGVFMYAVKAAAKLADAAGDRATEEKMNELHDRLRKAARATMWDGERGLFVSGSEKQISWASQIWMILGGAVNAGDGAALLDRIASEPDAVGMVTPYLYHHYIDALISVGRREQALDVLRSYWGGMADLGADTFWELYNPADPNESPYGGTIVNSYCHAWSCAPAYFLRRYYAN